VAKVAERAERKIAVQEYGKPNPHMQRALQNLGAQVSSVSLYRWQLPDDVDPLRKAAHRLARDEFEIVLFTSSIQLEHLLEIAPSVSASKRECVARSQEQPSVLSDR
jgi:uroporphyrinogen-III synthase